MMPLPEQSPMTLMSSTPEVPPPPPEGFPFPERLPVGATLNGAYEITGFLSRGGFADVYRAIKLDIDMGVAIKVLRPQSSDIQTEIEERFYLDALAASRIRHPNVASILAYHDLMTLKMRSGAEATFPRRYFVMELLQGSPFDEVLKEGGPLAPARALGLMTRCLEGLAEGHHKKIVHKDLKPENLFLTFPERLAESLTILDFGTARLKYDAGEGARLTKTGNAICTPEYTAPEYFEQGLVSPALDVYQMGLILTEMLTGETLVKGRPYECIQIHTKGIELPEPLLAGSLGPVIKRATALDHTERYPDAAAFCEALRGVDADAIWPGEAPERPDEAPAIFKESLQAHRPDFAPEPIPPIRPRSAPRHLIWALLALAGLLTMALAFIAVLFLTDTGRERIRPPDQLSGTRAGCGTAQACSEKAEKAVDSSDLGAAASLFNQACELRAPKACLSLGWMHYEGRGVSKDGRRSVDLFRKACMGGVGEGCTALGLMYEEGTGVKKSFYASHEFYEVGCDASDGWGCHVLGEFNEHKGLMKKAFRFYRKSCNLGFSEACTDQGRIYEANRGFVKRDFERAAALHRQSCEARVYKGCTNLARLHEKGLGGPPDGRKAITFYTLACEGDDMEACLSLGALYERGDLVLQDFRKALDHYEHACRKDFAPACRNQKRLARRLEPEGN